MIKTVGAPAGRGQPGEEHVAVPGPHVDLQREARLASVATTTITVITITTMITISTIITITPITITIYY